MIRIELANAVVGAAYQRRASSCLSFHCGNHSALLYKCIPCNMGQSSFLSLGHTQAFAWLLIQLPVQLPLSLKDQLRSQNSGMCVQAVPLHCCGSSGGLPVYSLLGKYFAYHVHVGNALFSFWVCVIQNITSQVFRGIQLKDQVFMKQQAYQQLYREPNIAVVERKPQKSRCHILKQSEITDCW